MLRTLLFAFMGAGVLVFSFVAWSTLHPPAAPAPVIPKVVVLAAASTLRAGTLLKPDDIEAREMPESEAPAGARKDSPQARADYALPDWGTQLQLLWGKAYKLPSFYALGNPIVGDPNLKPEEAENFEGGVTQ